MRIPGIFVEVRGDYSFLREDLDKAKTIAKAGATDIANSLNGAMDARGVSTNTNALINNISKVQSASKNASVDFAALTKSTEGVGGAVGMTDKAFASFQARMLQTKAQEQADKAFNALTKSMGMSRLESAQFHMQMGDTAGGLKILGGMAMSAAPYLLAVGAAAIYAGKACFDSALAADRLNKAYGAIEGSSTGARQQLKFLYDESNRLGMQFQDSAAAAKGFFAAGKGTSLEGDLRKIYSSVSEAGTALSLSKDEMGGVFMALGQMMSKGKVQAEELRGQLGERLPGAFTLAAKSMGVTTAELDKMLEQGQVLAEDLLPKLADALHEKYGKAAIEAADGAAQSVNRMSTEWELFKSNVMDTDGILGGIRVVTDSLKGMNRGLVESKMMAAGITPDNSGKMNQGWYESAAFGADLAGSQYSDAQIKAFQEFGTTDTDLINKQVQAQLRAQLEMGQNVQKEKILAQVGAATKDYLKDTPEMKVQKANDEYEDVMKKLRTAREAFPEQADRWRAKEVAATQKHQQDIADIGKKGVASAKKDAREHEQVTDAYYSYVGTKTEDSLDLMEDAESRKHDKLAASIQKQYGATAQGQEMLYNLSVAYSEKVEKLYADADKKREDAAKKALEEEQKIAFARRDIAEAMQDKMFQATGTDAQKKAAQTEKEIREWREKWEKMGLGTMEEFDNMAAHYREVMGKANDETAATFRKLWENAIDRIDGAFANMWKDFITGSKSAMESLKSMFQNTLAEIAHAAITRPIVVQMSGMFTGSSLFSSTAYAGGGGIFSGGGTSGGTTGAGGVATGGASGSGMNVGSLVSPSWFTPSSWAASANSWAAQSMPGLFGASTNVSGQMAAYGSAYSTALEAGKTAVEAAQIANAAAEGAQVSLTGTLGATGIAGGIGMLLGNMLGDKTGGMSTGGGAAIGAGIGNMVVPGVGAIVGGLLGGLGGFGLSSIFGGGKGPRTASLYTNVQGAWGEDFEANAAGHAWGSRGMATDTEFAKTMYKWIGDTANTQRAEIQAIIDVTDNAAAVNKALESTQVAFGHGFRGRDGNSIYEWNKNSDMEANMEAIAEEMQEVLWEGVMNASKDLDWSSEDFTTDFSTVEGTQTTYATIAALAAINDAIGEIKEPTDGLTTVLKAVDTQFDAYKDTLEALGYGVKTLTQLEADRAEVLAKVKAEYTKAFTDDMDARYLALFGTSTEQQAQALRVKHENELTAAGTSYGVNSDQYSRLLAMQVLERNAFEATAAQATLATAQNNYVNALQSTYTAMKGFATSVKKLREDLLLDSELSTLSVTDRYGTASARLADLTAKALSGDTDAMAELQDVSRSYLEVSKEYNADFAAYRRDFDLVQSTLNQVESYASAQADAANAEVTAITGAVISIVAKLDELKAAFLTAQTAAGAATASGYAVANKSAEAAYLAANPDVAAAVAAGEFGSGLAHYSQFGQYESRATAGYSAITGEAAYLAANPDVARAVAAGEFISAAQHYALYGQAEGRHYATGGYASPGYAMVGEEGPELVQFKNPARVYTASQTRAALGGDGADLAGELRALRQEVAGMRAENERLLTSVARSSQKTTDTLEKFDFDGLPAEREA